MTTSRLHDAIVRFLDLGEIDRADGLPVVVEGEWAGRAGDVRCRERVEERLLIGQPAGRLDRLGDHQRARVALFDVDAWLGVGLRLVGFDEGLGRKR
jgi:hypothetical protein